LIRSWKKALREGPSEIIDCGQKITQINREVLGRMESTKVLTPYSETVANEPLADPPGPRNAG